MTKAVARGARAALSQPDRDGPEADAADHRALFGHDDARAALCWFIAFIENRQHDTYRGMPQLPGVDGFSLLYLRRNLDVVRAFGAVCSEDPERALAVLELFFREAFVARFLDLAWLYPGRSSSEPMIKRRKGRPSKAGQRAQTLLIVESLIKERIIGHDGKPITSREAAYRFFRDSSKRLFPDQRAPVLKTLRTQGQRAVHERKAFTRKMRKRS